MTWKVAPDLSDPTKYNSPEYYKYHEFSYYDIDSECVSLRIEQPSAPMKWTCNFNLTQYSNVIILFI